MELWQLGLLSAAGGDLELFTVDDAEAIGISHGGALNASQGLGSGVTPRNDYHECPRRTRGRAA